MSSPARPRPAVRAEELSALTARETEVLRLVAAYESGLVVPRSAQ